MFVIPNAQALVNFIKDFTGSSNDNEIKQCIFMAEMSMRNIELPALRCDPYAPENIGLADSTRQVAIPGDMNKPIIFFKQGNPGGANSTTGPWLVYDRVGDRDIITDSLLGNLYLSPVNMTAVIRGKFSEVAGKYQFSPQLSEGDLINLYYYRAWALLFAPNPTIISPTATVLKLSFGPGPWAARVSGLASTSGLTVGDVITATDAGGSVGVGGVNTITNIVDATTIDILVTGGTTPIDGLVNDVTVAFDVETNGVLQTFPEGYVYATLREYYIKRHNSADAAIYDAKFKEAYNVVEDQNNKGKWSGGHTRLTSIFQPRTNRRYSVK